ncbi:MAG: DUF4227 family protein [Bacillota bacterium]|nr:DUF4227 family protein [Bacillota bacterium]MDW7684065.1 DUF4227 family protein [Bacillota bacterium]
MIIVLGKRLYRFIVLLLVLFLIAPVIGYYFLRTLEPETVHFRQPRGDALKVSADDDADERNRGILSRYMYYLHEFYQNGL